jgi:hypothetical protein
MTGGMEHGRERVITLRPRAGLLPHGGTMKAADLTSLSEAHGVERLKLFAEEASAYWDKSRSLGGDPWPHDAAVVVARNRVLPGPEA